MGSVNKVILVGNVGKDPVVRSTQDGKRVANFSMATSEYFTDNHQQKQERTVWHNVVAFGRQGEIADQWIKKGKQVYVEGRIQYRKWTDRDGRDRYSTEIVASNIQLLGRREGAPAPAAAPVEPATASYPEPGYEFEPPPEDDTPF
ncbi:MAG: single-stranded DNA-binding protein [Acidobacteriota bacterium]